MRRNLYQFQATVVEDDAVVVGQTRAELVYPLRPRTAPSRHDKDIVELAVRPNQMVRMACRR